MGIRDLEFVAKRLGWIQRRASSVSKRFVHTDTAELVSTLCRRMGQLRDGDRFANSKEFEAYTDRVLNHAAIDHARKAKSESDRMRNRAIFETFVATEFPDLPAEAVEKSLNEMLLLGSGHRIILDMYCRGMKTSEIATATDMNENTVKSRIHEAKLQLRARVQSQA